MREYWVNIYKKNVLGNAWETRQQAIKITQSDFERNLTNYKPLYRIHVKMKPKPVRNTHITIMNWD